MYVAKANDRVHPTKFTWNDGRDQIVDFQFPISPHITRIDPSQSYRLRPLRANLGEWITTDYHLSHLLRFSRLRPCYHPSSTP